MRGRRAATLVALGLPTAERRLESESGPSYNVARESRCGSSLSPHRACQARLLELPRSHSHSPTHFGIRVSSSVPWISRPPMRRIDSTLCPRNVAFVGGGDSVLGSRRRAHYFLWFARLLTFFLPFGGALAMPKASSPYTHLADGPGLSGNAVSGALMLRMRPYFTFWGRDAHRRGV